MSTIPKRLLQTNSHMHPICSHTCRFLYESLNIVGGNAILSIAIYSFVPSLTFLPMASSISTIFSRVVVKVIDWYDLSMLYRFRLAADNIRKQYRCAHLIGMLFAIVIGTVSTQIGTLVAICQGTFTGFLFEFDLVDMHLKQGN